MTKEEEWLRKEALRIRKKFSKQPDELEEQYGSKQDPTAFYLSGKV